jgi:hypothetical protein
MPKLPEQQLRINTQFNEDLADLKTRQLLTGQALGAVVQALDGLVERLVARQVLQAEDPIVTEFRKAIDALRGQGLSLSPPADPEAPVFKVKCPNCQAVIKAEQGTRVARCDWCGHQFQESD